MFEKIHDSPEILNESELLANLQRHVYPQSHDYLAMYSSWYGGITRNPHLMLVPMDDHLVHRGDGIFEAIKFERGFVYCLRPHLERLARSASMVQMTLPLRLEEIEKIVLKTALVSGERDGVLRIYVSRGPGGFSPNPYESIGAQLYVVVTRARPLSPEKIVKGVSCMISSIPVKEGFFSTVKSCNYLANVLMKKEAVDRGFDFSINVDELGCLGEGATENFAFISNEGELLVPSFARTLRGITVTRIMDLIREKIAQPGFELRGVREANLTLAQALTMKEMLVIGTTLDVLPVHSLGDHKFADSEGSQMLRRLLRQDIESGPLRHKIE